MGASELGLLAGRETFSGISLVSRTRATRKPGLSITGDRAAKLQVCCSTRGAVLASPASE
jgi:hypothetical protein